MQLKQLGFQGFLIASVFENPGIAEEIKVCRARLRETIRGLFNMRRIYYNLSSEIQGKIIQEAHSEDLVKVSYQNLVSEKYTMMIVCYS